MSRPPRRIVGVSDSFFEQLDEQLGASRGPNGEPSSTGFSVMELPAVVERFAIDFDSLPELPDGLDRRDVRSTDRLLERLQQPLRAFSTTWLSAVGRCCATVR